jgi:hypothetical protein
VISCDDWNSVPYLHLSSFIITLLDDELLLLVELKHGTFLLYKPDDIPRVAVRVMQILK